MAFDFINDKAFQKSSLNKVPLHLFCSPEAKTQHFFSFTLFWYSYAKAEETMEAVGRNSYLFPYLIIIF